MKSELKKDPLVTIIHQNEHKTPPEKDLRQLPDTTKLRCFKTTLHLKQTKSSISKSNNIPLVTCSTPTDNDGAKPRILQRQNAFQKNSKESLHGEKDSWETSKRYSNCIDTKNRQLTKRGDPDGCEYSRRRCVTTLNNGGISDKYNDKTEGNHGHLRHVRPNNSKVPVNTLTSGSAGTKSRSQPGGQGTLTEKRGQEYIAKFCNNKKQLAKTPLLHNGDKEHGKEQFTFKRSNKSQLTNVTVPNGVGIQSELNNNDLNYPILEALIGLRDKDKKTTGSRKESEMGSNQTACCVARNSRSGGGDEIETRKEMEKDLLKFIVPLEPHVEVVEGSELELWVKIKGARKVIWVKNKGIIPHAPPDFIYNCNSVEGIYSLRIKDVFLQDSGNYICEVYGDSATSDCICWCNVQVIEDFEDDESSVDVVVLEAPRRKLIVPLIITTSDNSHMDNAPLSPVEEDVAADRRNYFANSSHSSREYEDALEDIHEVPDEEEIEGGGEDKCSRDSFSELESTLEKASSMEEEDISKSTLKIPEHANVTENCCEEGLEIVSELLQHHSSNAEESQMDTTTEKAVDEKIIVEEIVERGLRSQLSTESSGGSEPCRSSASLDEKDFDVSGSSVECNSGYVGTFRDSLSDNPLSPKFLMGPSNLIVMLGETVNLRVKIWTTDDSTEVSWCKLVRGVYQKVENSSEDDESHVEITQPTNDLVMMRISKANYEDSGKYRVKIQNSHGSDYHHCLVSVEGPPEPPATSPAANYDELTKNITISWSCCPFDGGSAILSYILEMKLKPKSTSVCDCKHETWIPVTSSVFKGLCYSLKNPKPSHTYYFRVCVENSHGKGKYSKTSDGLAISESEEVVHKEESKKMCVATPSEDVDLYEYQEVALQHKSFLLDYDKHEQLGKGRFGIVNKVTNKLSQKSYAGKFVRCIKAADKQRAELEYKIMNHLKYHHKLICLVDAYEMPREIVIVTEMINGGELFERVVADDFNLTERDCVTFLRQICDGVKYIHEKKIMHLDLKPENILCTQKNSNQIKIIDFGLAQYYNPEEPIRVLFGTAEFVSPEIINYETICPATDMWSVGVITYILLSGLSPFLGDDDNETFSNITRGDFDFEDDSFDKVSEDAKDFISSLILKRKTQRLTAEDCLNHKWLALSDEEKKDIVLSTDRLKRFLLRRKWQKTGNAIRALGRITTLYSSSRKSSSGSSAVSSPNAFGESRQVSKQESLEDSVFSPPGEHKAVENEGRREDFAHKARYDESCRSDSGIGGESGNYSLE